MPYFIVLQAVGEPPLFLAASVFFAIKEAIASARKDRGEEGVFLMDSPATCERIRLACNDQFTQMVGNVYTSYRVQIEMESFWCVGVSENIARTS